MKHQANLDILRSIAVALVVLDHTMLALGQQDVGPIHFGWLGSMGVFFFFLHTALVLMASLERRPNTLDFYIRRVFRIYPLACVAITIALLTHAPLQGTNEHFFQYRHAPAATVFSDYLLIQNFTAPGFSIIGVLWTLPLEVQMYVALPFLFFFARQERRVWPLLLLWTLVVAFSVQKFVDPNEINLLTAIPMFLPGVMAYVGFSRHKPRLPAWTLPPLIAALLAFGLYQPTNRKGWYLTLALGLALPLIRQARSVPVVTIASHIARYSYGVYLFHPFALVIAFLWLRGRPIALQLAAELIAIAVFSVAGYHLVEHPMIQLGSRVAARAARRLEHSSDPA